MSTINFYFSRQWSITQFEKLWECVLNVEKLLSIYEQKSEASLHLLQQKFFSFSMKTADMSTHISKLDNLGMKLILITLYDVCNNFYSELGTLSQQVIKQWIIFNEYIINWRIKGSTKKYVSDGTSKIYNTNKRFKEELVIWG